MADRSALRDPLGRMTDDELISGLRKVAAPMLAELHRRGVAVSISPSADAAPELLFVPNQAGGRGGIRPSRA